MKKCTCPKQLIGPVIMGEPFTIDPCVYENQQVISNCIVVVSKCKVCGYETFEWHRTDDSVDIPEEDWENLGL